MHCVGEITVRKMVENNQCKTLSRMRSQSFPHNCLLPGTEIETNAVGNDLWDPILDRDPQNAIGTDSAMASREMRRMGEAGDASCGRRTRGNKAQGNNTERLPRSPCRRHPVRKSAYSALVRQIGNENAGMESHRQLPPNVCPKKPEVHGDNLRTCGKAANQLIH